MKTTAEYQTNEKTALPLLLYQMGFITQEQLLEYMKLKSGSDELHQIGRIVQT